MQMYLIISAGMWLNEWQTLAAGIIALGAAWIGWTAVHRQIQQSERHELQRTMRRFDAARAVLPLGLASISRYAHTSMDQGLQLLASTSDKFIKTIPEAPPPIPTEGVEIISRFVETCDTGGVRTWLATLLADIQVHAARVNDNYKDANDPTAVRSVTRHCIVTSIIDAATIAARNDSLYKFARRQQTTVPEDLDWDSIRSAFGFRLLGDDDHEVLELIAARDKSGIKPGIT